MTGPHTAVPSDLDDALRAAARAERLVVACDFDGTLSPIVRDHEAAAADARALEPLTALASLPGTDVVVISGRARSDLASRLGSASSRVALIGSHGAELPDGTAGSHPEVETYAAALDDLVREVPGVSLERKPFSLALHYRNVAASRQEAVRASAIERLAATDATVKEGKKVVEFLAVRADKGTALVAFRETLMRQGERGEMVTVFVGDDVTDEAAFDRLAPPDVTVKVGPGETAANHALKSQDDVASLLDRLHRLRAETTIAHDADTTIAHDAEPPAGRRGSGS